MSAEDSGSAAHPVEWRAAAGSEVRLIGGVVLAASAFEPVRNAAALARLDVTARPHVLKVDLHGAGVHAIDETPVKFRGAPPLPELFFNDERMTLARWPNEGWATIAKIIDPGASPRTGDESGKPGVFEYEGDRPARWNTDAGVWLHGYWCYDWYEEAIQVASIDRQKRQIRLAGPSHYGLHQGNPSPRRYKAINLLEELDQPGEYYVDPRTHTLYFWPPAPIANARIVLSTLKEPVLALDGASHVVVRGLTIEASMGDGVQVRGGEDVRLQACLIRNTRERGVTVSGGSAHRVEACDIHHTGTGGLLLDGGDRKSLTAAGHGAVNNHIWRFSEHQFTYASAIEVHGVGNRVAHNLLHDAPHMAIGIKGNDHVIEFNIVHTVCTETDDAGACYKGRDPSCRGNVIQYNFWHHIGKPMGHGNAAIYFDDGDGGDRVIGNVFFRCGDPGMGSFGTVFSHGGHDLVAENNLFIECRRALGSAPWNDAVWAKALRGEDGHFWTKLLLQDVDITQPPFTTRYPALVGFMDPKPGQPRESRAKNNVMVMCGQASGGNWRLNSSETMVIDHDPGFINATKGDFRLRADSQVFTALPGFTAIPMEKMGLYSDELRPRLPAREWKYPPPVQAAAPCGH
ncbi:MAG: right-handed parallel beta-helix repeat-containing protein [Planctomycetes bacterium]|nr:right-handed parallel beta-helix repeat-containing protein [Planctomycetota bacterium]